MGAGHSAPMPAQGIPLKEDADPAEARAQGLREIGIDATALPGPLVHPNNIQITISTK